MSEESKTEDQSDIPEALRWKGSGPIPASWMARDKDGVLTKVYRSYADYCDD